jgi:hypothetical protein
VVPGLAKGLVGQRGEKRQKLVQGHSQRRFGAHSAAEISPVAAQGSGGSDLFTFWPPGPDDLLKL